MVWWREHFEELLNLTDASFSVEEAVLDGSGETLSVFSRSFLIEVVITSLTGEAPELDDIHPEMVKALCIVGLRP